VWNRRKNNNETNIRIVVDNMDKLEDLEEVVK